MAYTWQTIEFPMQRNPRYREGSSRSSPRSFSLPLFCSFRRRALTSDILITWRAPLSFSLSLSLSLARVISYPQRYYERACNGNRRMIHGDVKRDGSRCRLETQSLPIREQPMPREEREGHAFPFLIKILKRQSIKRIDIEIASVETLCHRFILFL